MGVFVEPSGDPAMGVSDPRPYSPTISNVQLFHRLVSEFIEDESRPGAPPTATTRPETAQGCRPALTVNGKPGDRSDVYCISAKAGEKRVIEVEARDVVRQSIRPELRTRPARYWRERRCSGWPDACGIHVSARRLLHTSCCTTRSPTQHREFLPAEDGFLHLSARSISARRPPR